MSPIAPAPAMPVLPGVTFRPYRGLEDIDAMAAANAALRRRVGVLEPIEPESMRHHYAHLVNSDPTTDCVLTELDGRTVGYVRVEWHDLNDGDRLYDTTLFVDPAAWGLGIHAALLGVAERRLTEIAAAHPTDRRAWFGAEAYDGDDEARLACLERGYEPVRRWTEMLRPDLADPLPSDDLPPGYAFRTVSRDDLRRIWDMLEAGFHEHWGEWEMGDAGYAEWSTDPRTDPALIVAAYRGDKPASVVLNIVERLDDGTRRGLLDGVATHPEHRRLGLARACIARSLARLRDAGATSAYLGVDVQNVNRALTLYESCGFRAVSGGVSYRRPFEATETLA